MAAPYSNPPLSAKDKIEPFELHVEEEKLQLFKQLISLSPVANECYENHPQHEGELGVTREWMLKAKEYWGKEYDWRKHEAHVNSFPQFKSKVIDDDGFEFNIHFTTLFSEREDATPLVLIHGWPGSFQEFLPILSLLKEKYTPQTLPYHVVLPSLPGYTLSSAPPLHKNWKVVDSARILHKLLIQLGLANYVVQGGDIGAYTSRIMAATYPECAGIHLNFSFMPEPPGIPASAITPQEQKGLARMAKFQYTGTAYGRMHGTRPATIGHVLSSSPLALLAWIAEKFLQWSDPSTTPSLETILTHVSLYWFCESFTTGTYPYAEDFREEHPEGYAHGQKHLFIKKPFGFSWFPWELMPVPRAWVERSGDLKWFRRHDNGGHFAALERSEALLGDVEGFVEGVRSGKLGEN